MRDGSEGKLRFGIETQGDDVKLRVSVVIPVAGRIEPLSRAIESVLAQTLQDFEIVVVENNSEDPSCHDELVASFRDPRLRLFHLPECANANVARNFGVAQSRGKYVAFLDSDDEWYPQHLETSLDCLERSRANFVYGAIDVFDGTKTVHRAARQLDAGEDPSDYLFGPKAAWAPTPTYVVERELATRIGWDESLRRHQDFDFFIRICRSSGSAANPAATVRVNWIKGSPRAYDSQSMIDFFVKHKGGFAKSTLRRFCWGKLKFAARYRNIRHFRLFFREFCKALR